jgi:hypothetical protein
MRSSKPTQASPPDFKAPANHDPLPDDTDTQQKPKKKKLVLGKERLQSLSSAGSSQEDPEMKKPTSDGGVCSPPPR